MRPVKSYIRTILNESLLDSDDSFYDPVNDKKFIEWWINNNYIIHGKLTISDDFVVDCDRGVYTKNRNIESLTNGMFRWGSVKGGFGCPYCDKLISLEGAPVKVGSSFLCNNCNNLTSLEGAPKEVGLSFYCSDCNNLKTLEGSPEAVRGDFLCSRCNNLTSLKGAPKVIGRGLYCSHCDNLKITNSDRKKYKIKD